MQHYSLLDEALISIRTRQGELRRLTLPELIVALLRQEVSGYEALQPHQQQAWHCLLVQLAAMVAARTMKGVLSLDVDRWKAGLLALSNGQQSAWALIVPDVTLPAFMQPPVPEGSLSRARYRDDVLTPDQLDVLITSKNFDIKQQRIVQYTPEHWIYALVTLQTTEGFLGQGNYGIIRMNGGFGSRPMMGFTPSLSPGAHFRRDVKVLLEARASYADRYDLGGHSLLWLLPWDGKKQSRIPLESCDPYFIEVCRRVRLLERNGQIVGCRANTAATRIAAPDGYGGVTGDPWAPVEKKGAKVLTVGKGGLTYRLLQRVLFSDEIVRPLALQLRDDEKEGGYFVARVLVREQGQTAGLHTRIVPISRTAVEWLTDTEDRRSVLGRIAQERVDQAAEVQRNVLYPALSTLLQKGSSRQISAWLEMFDRVVDAHFFDHLWMALEVDEKTARSTWERFLLQQARRLFEQAEQSIPMPTGGMWKIRSNAHAVFEAAARKVLPHAFSPAPVNLNG